MTRALVILLVLASLASAQDAQDFVYLGPEPVFLRVRVLVDGKDYHEPFRAWVRGIFDKIDADHDGRLSTEEAAKLPDDQSLRSAESNPVVRAKGNRDQNGDGWLDFEELVQAVATGAGPAMQVRLLSQMLPNNRQSVSYGQPLQDVQRIFKQLDTDKDRRLVDSELRAAQAVLQKLDRDDDDSVSQQEIASANPYAMYYGQQDPAYSPRPQLPFLELTWADVSAKSVRRFFQHYDKSTETTAADLVLSRTELPLSESVFQSHDANKDAVLDFDEVLALLKQSAPQVEFTLHVSDQWQRTPVIDVVCHDARMKDRVRRSLSGEVTLDLGLAQMELAVPASNQFDSATFLEQQFKQADSDNNGYVELKDVRNSYYINQIFPSANSDNDDKLFLDELRKYINGRKQAGESRIVLDLEDDGRNLFEILDVNRDRRMSPSEVKALAARIPAWDADQDGALGESEVPQHFRLSARRGQAQIPGLNFVGRATAFGPAVIGGPAAGPGWFTKMDRNSDGEVTPREFLGPPTLFTRLDLDGDGSLKANEAQSARP